MLNFWCFDWNILLRQVLLRQRSTWESWLDFQILIFGVPFLLFILLTFLFSSSTLKYLNENTFGSIKKLFIHKIFEWILHFLIAFSTRSVSSITSVWKLSSFSIFNFLTTLLKNSLKVSATFDQNVPVFKRTYSRICQITFIWK